MKKVLVIAIMLTSTLSFSLTPEESLECQKKLPEKIKEKKNHIGEILSKNTFEKALIVVEKMGEESSSCEEYSEHLSFFINYVVEAAYGASSRIYIFLNKYNPSPTKLEDEATAKSTLSFSLTPEEALECQEKLSKDVGEKVTHIGGILSKNTFGIALKVFEKMGEKSSSCEEYGEKLSHFIHYVVEAAYDASGRIYIFLHQYNKPSPTKPGDDEATAEKSSSLR